jgi:hypothetical protein
LLKMLKILCLSTFSAKMSTSRLNGRTSTNDC